MSARSRRPTGRLAAQDPTATVVNLVVDYVDSADFLDDYAQNLSGGTLVLDADRQLAAGTSVKLRVSFLGLLAPVLLDGVVEACGVDDLPSGIRVQILSRTELAAIAERIAQRDPSLVARVVKVLIVEDNHHVSTLVANGLTAAARRHLAHVEFVITTAGDGAEALELLKHEAFDAAIVDVYLPVLDGPTMIRQARTTLGLVDLRIITMSAGGESARAEAMLAGANVFLHKPVRLREVIETMRELINV